MIKRAAATTRYPIGGEQGGQWSPVRLSHGPAPEKGFTLIELLVVLALLAVAVGMAAVQWNGVSARVRLESAAAQIADWFQLGRREARLAGEPRLLVYGRNSVTLHKPTAAERQWRWDRGRAAILPYGVNLLGVRREGETKSEPYAKQALSIGSNGRAQAHAVVLAVGDHRAVLTLANGMSPRLIFPEGLLQAEDFEILLTELVYHHEEP